VIHHSNKDIIVQTKNFSDENIYISSIKIDGKSYPSYMIPAKRLIKGIMIEIELNNDSTKGLGDLYVSSSDGYVLNAEVISKTHIKCTIEAAVEEAITKIYCSNEPIKVIANGKETNAWKYDQIEKTLIVQTEGTANLEVLSQ
jgi:hypothetical protein